MTTFKQIYYKPTDRQFVAMWEYNGKIWSDTVCWIEEEENFLVWNDDDESYCRWWTPSEYVESTVKYFVLED